MNKKFLSAILFGALMVTSTGTFVSCKDYDEEIEDLQGQISANASSIADLKALIGDGNYVTSVTVNGQNLVVNTKNGSTTVALPECEGGSQAEVKGGELFIDGKATGIKVAVGEAVKVVEGEWAILQADGTYVSTNIPASGVTVVENGKGGYTLTVVDAEGESTEIELAATKTITDLTAASINGEEIGDAEVTLYYGSKITADKGLTFNGKTYAKGTYLLSQNAALSAIVNPLDADATKYAFKLVDTKGNAPFVVSDVKQNMSENALSRADKTANQGVWDMTLAFADASKVNVSGTYALTTETANGTVASPYDVNVTTVAAPEDIDAWVKEIEGNYNTDIDLTGAFTEERKTYEEIWVNNFPWPPYKDFVEKTENNEWIQYMVDYTFEITDETAAAKAGVSLDGKYIKCSKNETTEFNKVLAKILLVNGEVEEKEITVNFKYVAPTAQLGNVEWTITNEENKNVVYLSLKALQSQLTANLDTQLPTYEATGTYTWADGTALDKKSVVVNDVYYGAAVEGKTVTKFADNDMTEWIASVGGLYVKNDKGNMVAATASTKIQDELYAQFTFDAENAFPGAYIVELGFKKSGSTKYDLVVPVKVTITEPTVNPFTRLSAYFNGDDATAYGNVTNGVAVYDLFDLYKEMESADKNLVTFDEANHDVEGHECEDWLTTEKGIINVPVYDAEEEDNMDAVYSTRTIKAIYKVFNNAHITNVVDEFNLTIKSAIKEGAFSSEASKTIETSEPVKFFVTDFNGVDVYGEKYYIGTVYKKSGDNWVVDGEQDDRIADIDIEAADENAENYLTINDNFEAAASGDKTQYFTVARKSSVTKLEKDLECKVKVTLTDVWGVSSEAIVTVTLKKF